MSNDLGARARGGLPLAFAAAAISGFAVFINGYGVRAVPDATVYTTAKNLVAAAVLVVVAAVATLVGGGRRRGRGASAPARRLRPRQWLGLAAVGVVGGSVPFLLFFEGLSRASSTHAAFIHKTLVVWVALLAVLLLGERLRGAHVAAVALLVGGLVVLDDRMAGFAFGDGELLILAATLLWSVEIVLVKRLLRNVAPATVGLARMGLGVGLLLGWVAISGRWSVLAGLGAEGWGWALLTGAVLAGYVTTWFTALSRAAAVDVTAVLVVGAVITGLLNALVKGAPLPAVDLAGMALLVAGAAVVAAAATRRRPALEPAG
jgi:drug/metabolite transporter (DMT)-like permease